MGCIEIRPSSGQTERGSDATRPGELARALRVLAHDLRGPAGAVRLAGDVLARRPHDLAEGDLEVAVSTLRGAVEALDGLAGRLLELSERTP